MGCELIKRNAWILPLPGGSGGSSSGLRTSVTDHVTLMWSVQVVPHTGLVASLAQGLRCFVDIGSEPTSPGAWHLKIPLLEPW